MIILDYVYKGAKYRIGVEFDYIAGEDGKPQDTLCEFINPETGEMFAWGVANLHPNDRFNRSTGRKVAFAAAIEDCLHNVEGYKDFRKALWDAFFTKVKMDNRDSRFKQ